MLGIRTALLVQVAVTALVIVASGAAARDTAARPTTLASATSLDYRVVVSARKNSGGSTPTAAVIIAIYKRSNSSWHSAGSKRLSGTYFWKTVSAPHSVCRLEIDTASSSTGVRPRAIVQLLVSPSIGCGKPQTILLPD